MNQTTAADTVYRERPMFGQIITEHGERPFLTYLKHELLMRASPDVNKITEFLPLFENFLKTWISIDDIQPVIESLKKTWVVGTADHHGIPWHPFFASENLAHARYMHVQGISHAIVFSASGVSLGNSSLPRSIGFHNNDDLLLLHFFPASMRHQPVYGTHALPSEKFKSLASTLNTANINPAIKKKMAGLISAWEAMSAGDDTFSNQLTSMNHALWEHIPVKSFSRLISIPLEELTVFLLHHLPNNHIAWQLLTSKAQEHLSSIEGIQGAHNHDLTHGSHLFWYLDPKGTRRQLTYNNGVLRTGDGQVAITLTHESILQSLAQKRIYPTYSFCLMLISCYFGITCMGGFSQVGYLPQIHNAYKKLFPGTELYSNPSVFCGEMVASKTPKGNNATLIDIIVNNDFNKIIDTLEHDALCTLVEPLLPELAKILS